MGPVRRFLSNYFDLLLYTVCGMCARNIVFTNHERDRSTALSGDDTYIPFITVFSHQTQLIMYSVVLLLYMYWWFSAVSVSRRRFITREQGIAQSVQRLTNTEVASSPPEAVTNTARVSGLQCDCMACFFNSNRQTVEWYVEIDKQQQTGLFAALIMFVLSLSFRTNVWRRICTEITKRRHWKA